MPDHLLFHIFMIIVQPAAIFFIGIFSYFIIVCVLIKGITNKNDKPKEKET